MSPTSAISAGNASLINTKPMLTGPSARIAPRAPLPAPAAAPWPSGVA